MDTKDTSAPEEPQKPWIRTVPISLTALERIKDLQDGFYEIAKARISQTVIAEKAIAKVTLADLLPQPEASR